MTSINKKTVLFLSALALSSQLSAVSYAADFAGSLKGVTITDSGGTNTPPTAVINYTQDGAVVNFDASSSTDSDGSITEYRWDFGDGSTGSGTVASHTYLTSGNFPATLTVIDSDGGVAISQSTVAAGCISNITDDFTGDLRKWTTLHGGPFNLDSANNELDYTDRGAIIYTDEETCDTDQWVAATFNAVKDYAWDGVYLRSTNNMSEPAYAVRGDTNSSGDIAWRYCYGHVCTTIAEKSVGRLLNDSDSLGVEIQGAGNDTIVNVWIWADQGIPSRGNWGVPTVTFTDNPPITADTGKYTGLYAGGTTSSSVDSFQAGHILP